MGKLSVCVEIGFWLIHHFTSFPFDWLVCRRRRLKQLDGVSFQQEFYNEKGKLLHFQQIFIKIYQQQCEDLD